MHRIVNILKHPPGNLMAKIMVVDDDKEFTTLYREFLTMVGFETICENQSSKAMDLANAVKPDLFILDLMMPEPDGFKLCRMLRTNMNFVHTPIIIVTALNDEDSKVVALGAGANDYLTKPFHIDQLKLRIDLLLERYSR
jgi:DNA-binding response OmpR family regulator